MAPIPSQSAALTKQFQTLLVTALSQSTPSTAESEAQLKAGHDKIQGDGELKRMCLDSAFRQTLTQHVINPASEPDLSQCQKLVDLAIVAARLDLCAPTVPIVVLSDVFDLLTLEHCHALFGCVEDNVKIWREARFFPVIKNNLLRICNDMLRRLSRTQNTAFCGRILVFLAKFFPFSDRSGLNVISEFNLDNVTVFSESSEEFDARREDSVVIEEDGKNLNIDYALYRKFWQLQDFFRNPIQCYEKLKWKTFSTYANDVLSTFQSFKLDAVSGKRKHENAIDKVDEQYFAKYLTNQNLLQLQLSDSNFRRYILIQFLILFQYLQSTVKFKSDTDVLSDEQTRWVQNSTSRIYTLMRETPPEGHAFAKSIQHILNRGKQWNAWKNEGCKSFREDTTKENGQSNGGLKRPHRKRQLGREICQATAAKRFIMGNKNLTDLWNLYPDNLDACAASERDFLPGLEEYFEEALEQLKPENQVEEDYKKVNDGSWGWRALRLLAKKSPHFFTHGNNPIARLPDYLQQMLGKMGGSQSNGAPSTANLKDNPNAVAPNPLTKRADEVDPPNDSKGVTGDDDDENNGTGGKVGPDLCTETMLEKLAVKVGKYWKKMAPKLGVADEAVAKIGQEDGEDKDRCLKLFKQWIEIEAEGATVDEMIYILEGLKMKPLAEGILFTKAE
ncbi:hypothetical protein TCAL_11711 [Tigriopus californicus]|uniref:Death domain-containing protein n=1 Tax=Tigriopus californicus TaxID=6832 RepID=A0A553ND93_TIGCA|nr:THO complex subunit 1-like [Tigriopus californicus]TRY63385.1 hypothetical protein TCAL_11711 [Tigriopus californicus]